MARSTATALSVQSREPGHSRATRRLRREGLVPGVIYGGGDEPVAFQVDARELRNAIAHAGAVIDVSVDGGKPGPVLVKETQRHPVRGETVHVDLLRVRLDKPIHAMVTVEFHGAEDAPGVREGGVLEHVTRELNIEALPAEIPDSIVCDVSGMAINDTITLAALTPPPGVTLLDDLEETVIATLTPPRLRLEDEEGVEEETGLVGEGEATGEAEAEAEGEAPAEGSDSE